MKIGKYETSLTFRGKILIYLLLVGVLVSLAVIPFLPKAKAYYTCDDLWVDGIGPQWQGKDAHYIASLDKDHDGISCE